MRIKGMAKTIKTLNKMQDKIGLKIDEVDLSTTKGCELDVKLNDVWTILDDCMEQLKEIKNI